MPRGKPIKAGDKVLCQYFNRLEGEFYGSRWVGTVVEVAAKGPPVSSRWYETETRDYTVKKGNGLIVRLHRKEIKRVLISQEGR